MLSWNGFLSQIANLDETLRTTMHMLVIRKNILDLVGQSGGNYEPVHANKIAAESFFLEISSSFLVSTPNLSEFEGADVIKIG